MIVAQYKLPFMLRVQSDDAAFIPHADVMFGTEAANKP